MSELLSAFHAVGDGVALVVGVVLAWAAFFFVGPVLCAVLVLLRAAGAEVPADAELLFAGTAAAWILALVGSLVVRAVTAAWRSLRESAQEEAKRRARAAAEDMRAGRPVPGADGWAWQTAGASGAGPTPRPNPFKFSFRDPWVAWAAAEADRIRREAASRARAARSGAHSRTGSGAGSSAGRGPGAGSSGHGAGDRARGAPPPRPAPPRPPEPEPHVVLGVPRSASADVIRKAYRELVKKHHPDKVTDRSAAVRKAAHQRILEIRRAYDALKDGRRT